MRFRIMTSLVSAFAGCVGAFHIPRNPRASALSETAFNAGPLLGKLNSNVNMRPAADVRLSSWARKPTTLRRRDLRHRRCTKAVLCMSSRGRGDDENISAGLRVLAVLPYLLPTLDVSQPQKQ